MHTEEQAKHLWCPFVRDAEIVYDNAAHVDAHNPAVASNSRGRCRGTGCMAWRWGPQTVPPETPSNVDPETVRFLSAGMKLNAIKHDRSTSGRGLRESKDYVEGLALSLGLFDWRAVGERRGYCGLSGQVTP